MIFFWTLFLIIFGFLSILAYKNSFHVVIDLWPFDYQIDTVFPLIIGVTFGAGLILGAGVISLRSIFKRKKGVPVAPQDVSIS